MSNVYAAALWEIDDQLADGPRRRGRRLQHGTVVECGSAKPLYMYYTPLCAPTAADATAGDLAAQPEYYGLAAVHEIGTGDFLNVTNPDSANVHAYAVRHSNGTVTVVLDDFAGPVEQRRHQPAARPARVLQLGRRGGPDRERACPPPAASRSAGRRCSPTARLPAPTETPISVDGDTVTVSVPAGTAELLTFGSSSGGGTSTTFIGGLSGKCLSVSGASTANGATTEIWTCNASPSENWTIESNGTIVGGLSGECLEVAGGSTANYAGVDIGTCDGAASQQWTVNSGGTVVGTQSGKCLSVTGAARPPTAPWPTSTPATAAAAKPGTDRELVGTGGRLALFGSCAAPAAAYYASRRQSAAAPARSAPAAHRASTPRPCHGREREAAQAGGGLDGQAGAHRADLLQVA